MHFEKDVFISYAHLDNKPLPLGKEGWISVFDQCLRVFLGEYLGRDANVWRDPRLESNSIFADEILANLLKSAVLIAVLSPRYVQSKWCIKEIKQFQDVIRDANLERLGNISRIFKVEKLPVAFEDYPPEFEDLKQQLSCQFFEKDPSTGKAREFRSEFGDASKQSFLLKISDLAQEVVALLKGLEHYSVEIKPTVSVHPTITYLPEKTVYLALTASDLEEERNSVRRELEAQGYRILPTQPLPTNVKSLCKQVRQDLQHCGMSIHLIGQSYGVVPEGSHQSEVALQNYVAAERSQANKLSRLIWLPPTLPSLTDERQQKYIDYLQNDPEIQKGADILQVPLEELKTVALSNLKCLSANGLAKNGLANREVRIYLDFDRQDLINEDTKTELNKLYGYLKRVCKKVHLPDKRESVLSFVDDRLKQADAVMIYFGHGNKDWLKERWQATTKARGYAKAGALQTRAIYMGSPITSLKQSINNSKVLLIKNFGTFSPRSLDPFLKQLEAVREDKA